MPSVSPDLRLKETPSTAFTAPTCFWKMIPRVIGKYFLTFSTMSSSSPRAVIDSTSAPSGNAALAGLLHHRFQQLRCLALLGVVVEMACLAMFRIVPRRKKLGDRRLADAHHVRAAGMEAAARGRAQER